MKFFLIILFSILGGILGGMGMGGGTVLIPLLTICLNIAQQSAQAINLIAFLPMSIIALIIHFKNKLVKYQYAIPIAISGVLCSIFSAYLASIVEPKNLSICFGVFLIIVGVFDMISIWIFKVRKKK